MPQLIMKETNWCANKKKKEAWQAKGNDIRMDEEKGIQNGLFKAKEDGRRRN